MKPKELYIIGAFLALIALTIYSASNKSANYSWSDAEGYYMYLPALTIYGFSDIPLRTPGQFPKNERTGRHYDKYTAGVALMQLPFYCLASVYAGVSTKYEVDGYAPPFQWSILLAALFYVFCGLFMLYRYLRKNYSSIVSVAALICIFFGTNLFYYTYWEPGMAHAYAFFLWVMLICYADKIYETSSWKNFFTLSVIISLLVFIRPSNAVGAILILFWNAGNLRTRFQFIARHFTKYAILILPFLFFGILQLLLWRHMNGETLFYSYTSEPGFIYFNKPKIGNVLFHVHNGLFIYAPILALSVIGLFVGVIRKQQNFILIATILALSTYVFASWWAWWFGGAYGHRCYVDLLPLFAIPIAYLFQLLSRTRIFEINILSFLVCAILIYYSIQMTIAYRSPWDGPNFGWAEYWAIFREVVI